MTSHVSWRKPAGVLAMAFGLLTLVAAATTLSGAIDMGAVVPFVLWFNLFAGFAYLLGGVLLWRGSRRALPLAIAIMVATLAVFAAFGLRAASGGAFEMRTVGAMTLRIAFWAAIAWIAWKTSEQERMI